MICGMPLLKSVSICLGILLPFVAQICAQAPVSNPQPTAVMPSDPAEILKLISAQYQLLSPEIKPWHMLAKFQLFDPKGNPTETGTFEEFYAGPHKQKITYAAPSFSRTETWTSEGVFYEGDPAEPPYAIELALREVLDPKPSETDLKDAVMLKTTEAFGKTKLTCIMLSRPMKEQHTAIPPGLFPTFCSDPAKPLLRASYSFGDTTILFNNIGRFLGNTVPLQVTIFSGTPKLIELSVTTLATMPTVSDSLFIPPARATKINPNAAKVEGAVIAGKIIKKAPPVYPSSARAAGISGTVLLSALIGEDGIIRELKVISAPDASLALASLIAVRQWQYQPYLLNGAATKVLTKITVNFSIGYR